MLRPGQESNNSEERMWREERKGNGGKCNEWKVRKMRQVCYEWWGKREEKVMKGVIKEDNGNENFKKMKEMLGGK